MKKDSERVKECSRGASGAAPAVRCRLKRAPLRGAMRVFPSFSAPCQTAEVSTNRRQLGPVVFVWPEKPV